MSSLQCVFCFGSFIFFPDNVIFPISSFYLKCYSFLCFYNYFSSVLVFCFFRGYSSFFINFFPQFWVLKFLSFFVFCFFLMKYPFIYNFNKKCV